MPPIVDPKKCSGCGTCAQICPTQVFRFDRKKYKTPSTPFAEECWHCSCCVMDCPTGAIRLRIPVPFIMLHVDASALKSERSEHAAN